MPNNSVAPRSNKPTPADIAWRVSLLVYDARLPGDRILNSTIIAGSAEQAISRARDNAQRSGFIIRRTVQAASMAGRK